MVTSVTAITRPGAILQTGSNVQIGSSPSGTNPMALHIEQYGGMVEGTIARKSVMANFVPMRPVKGTSTLSDFRIGESTLSKVTPGTAPDGTVNQVSKFSITVDTVINARNILPLLDDFQNSFDARSKIGLEHGKKIAKFYDQSAFIQSIRAAHHDGSGLPSGWNGGSIKTLANAGDENDPARLYAALADLVAMMQEKDVDPMDDGAVLVLRPTLYGKLIQADQLIDSELITSAGNVLKTKTWAAMGIPVLSSNNLPNTNITGHMLSNAGNSNAFDFDCSKVIATLVSPEALLAGETIPVTSDVWYDKLTKCWFVDSHSSFTYGIGNPAYAGVLKAA